MTVDLLEHGHGRVARGAAGLVLLVEAAMVGLTSTGRILFLLLLFWLFPLSVGLFIGTAWAGIAAAVGGHVTALCTSAALAALSGWGIILVAASFDESRYAGGAPVDLGGVLLVLSVVIVVSLRRAQRRNGIRHVRGASRFAWKRALDDERV